MKQYKRFLLIAFSWYYPSGGISDIVGDTDDYEEALAWFNKEVAETSLVYCASGTLQVFDCQERLLILEWNSKD
jgi:hypothetical protein